MRMTRTPAPALDLLFLFCSHRRKGRPACHVRFGETAFAADPFVTETRVEDARDPFVAESRVEDARPSQELLVFRRHPETGLPVEAWLRWGLIPHWMATRPKIQPINARAESLTEKPMFRDAYTKRRCIVPMDPVL